MVGMGGGGWKRIAFGGNKERFVRIKGFWFVKKLAFSAHTRLSDKEKTFFSTQRHRLRTATKLTCSHDFLSATTYCELAVHHFFFEKHRSCVCTTVTLSHRFKAFTPAFCRQNRFRHEPPEFSAKLLPAEL